MLNGTLRDPLIRARETMMPEPWYFILGSTVQMKDTVPGRFDFGYYAPPFFRFSSSFSIMLNLIMPALRQGHRGRYPCPSMANHVKGASCGVRAGDTSYDTDAASTASLGVVFQYRPRRCRILAVDETRKLLARPR